MSTPLRSLIVLALAVALVAGEPPSYRVRRPQQYRRHRLPQSARQEFAPAPTAYPSAQELKPNKPFLHEQALAPAQTYGPPEQTYGPPEQTYGPPPPTPQQTYGAPSVPEATTETAQGQPEDFAPNPEAEEFLRIRRPPSRQQQLRVRLQPLPARQVAVETPLPPPAVAPVATVPVVDTPLPAAAAIPLPPVAAAVQPVLTAASAVPVPVALPQWPAQAYSFYVVNQHPFAYSTQYQTW